jgi:hypothetical protein
MPPCAFAVKEIKSAVMMIAKNFFIVNRIENDVLKSRIVLPCCVLKTRHPTACFNCMVQKCGEMQRRVLQITI